MIFHSLTTIVPRLPPSVDGVGDYGLTLARKMKDQFQIESEFIVTDLKWIESETSDGFPTVKLINRQSDLLNQLHRQNVKFLLLHYVGYGYAKRGSPFWLINTLEKWKQKNPQSKLIVMFHELYAFGPIWTSQFWTSPLQRSIVARLANLADACVTSKKIYAEILQRYTKGKHYNIPVLPIFSNVGEREDLKPLHLRQKRLVIFGSKVPRTRVYQQSLAEIELICKRYGINEILDIGSPLGSELPLVNGIKVQQVGIKNQEEISHILADSLAGFINYPTEYLAKSGIFAAYCSHGVLPLAAFYEKQRIDSVINGQHYIIASQCHDFTLDHAQIIAENANRWYKEHGQSVHAETFCNILKTL